MNPYSGAGFFEFFAILFQRLAQVCMGAPLTLATDEVQLAVLACCAIACGLIGPFLVLKRMTMFANSLSHTSLLGVVGAFLIGSSLWDGTIADISILLLGAFIAALLTAGLTETLSRLFRLQPDASIGLVFTTLFALGVICVTLFTKNAHISTEAVMGNPDALQWSDLKLSALIAFLNIGLVLFLYRRLQLASFDEPFAKAIGAPANGLRLTLFLLTSATCTGAFRAVGVLVVLALLTGPYLTARLFCHRLSHLLIWTPCIGLVACTIGVALSRSILSWTGMPLSTSGLIATFIALIFLSALFVRRRKKTRTGWTGSALPAG
jgi:manganese/zinc/iron transport system permease protein